MKSTEYPALEKRVQEQQKQFRYDAYVRRLLSCDFDAVLGIMTEAECCLVALEQGCPPNVGDADFWLEDCATF